MLEKSIENIILFTIVAGFVAALNMTVYAIETFVPHLDAPVFITLISGLLIILYKLDRSLKREGM